MTNRRSSFLLVLLLICTFFPLQAFAEIHCDPLSVYMEQGSVFILLQAFETIRNIFSSIANGAWAAFSLPLQGVVAIGSAIYIAMYTLKNLGSFSMQDASAYLGKVLPILLKAAFIVFLLGHADIVYKWMISPIIEVGAIFSGAGGSGIFSSSQTFQSAGNLRGLFDIVIDQAKDFNNNAYQLVAMGRIMLCGMILPGGIFDWHWSLLPFGATLFVFGWLIIIGVSFYMLDVLFRLGVGCTVLPLALACGLSKHTVKYTRSTWALFLNTAFSFVMLNIIINFAVAMITRSISSLATFALVSGAAVGLFELLNVAEVTDAVFVQLVEQLSLKGFLLMSLSCLIAFKLCMQVDTIVQKIAGGGKAPGALGQEMGGSIAKRAQKMAQAPVKQLKKFGGAIAAEASESVGRSIGRTRVAQSLSKFRRASRAWVKRRIFRLED